LFTAGTHAYPDFMMDLPDEGRSEKCAYCHVSTNGGGEINDFGNDFKLNDNKYNNNLSALDSDGDGFTNKDEFEAKPSTNPGDPDSYPDPESERTAIIITVIGVAVTMAVGLILIWRK
jgi:hypothetical protein